MVGELNAPMRSRISPAAVRAPFPRSHRYEPISTRLYFRVPLRVDSAVRHTPRSSARDADPARSQRLHREPLGAECEKQSRSISRGLKINKNSAEGEVFLVDFPSYRTLQVVDHMTKCRKMERGKGIEPLSSGWRPEAQATRPTPQGGVPAQIRTEVRR